MAASREHGLIVPRGTILSPPPPGVRHVRVPWLGIVIADDSVRQRVERWFHRPMIILALVLMPLLIFDVFVLAPSEVLRQSWVGLAAAIAFGLIWLMFLFEFLVKVAVAECRVEYCKRNWLDIIIICLPAFLPLRAAFVARTTRLFTLRSLGFRLARAFITLLVGLEATEQFLTRAGLKRKKGARLPEEMTRTELMHEVKRMRALAEAWERWHAGQTDSSSAQVMNPVPTAGPRQDDAGEPSVKC